MKYIGILILSVAFSLSISFQAAVAQSNHSLYTATYKKAASPAKEIHLELLTHSPKQLQHAKETVSGTVTDAQTGDALVGVNILVVGTTNGTVTDIDGHYTLSVSSLQDTLRFSYIGYKTRTVAVSGRTTLNISLQSSITGLNQLVVTGFGTTTKRENLTSAVSTISSKEIENKPVTSTDALLQGRSAGVQVLSSSGIPGQGLRVKIRGTTSIQGNSQPLYIVDGVPIQSSSFGTTTSGTPNSALAFINPNNIATITVLKDASATAIYGARAANGVVIIKTKHGINRPPEIHFSVYGGVKKSVNTPNLVDGPTYEMLQNEAARNNGLPLPYPNPEDAVTTYWPGYVFKRGNLRKYDLSIRGGNNIVKYNVSGGHYYNLASVQPNQYNRSNGHVNITIIPSDKLSIGSTLTVSKSHRQGGQTNNSIHSVVAGSYFYPANLPPRQTDGSYTSFSILENPLVGVNEAKFNSYFNRFIGNVNVKYNFTPNFYGKLSESYDYILIRQKRYLNTKTVYGSPVNGQANVAYTNVRSWTSNVTFNYKKSVKKNNFTVLVGGRMENTDFGSSRAQGQQFPSNAFRYLDASAIQSATSFGSSHGLASYFGRLQYNYAQRYLLTLTIRRDASSRFGEDHQWGTFPSAGIGWRLSEEPFFNVPWISNFKIRASWGITGNQSGIGNYQSLGLWNGGNYAEYPGTVTSQLANPNLKWEKTRQYDIGIDVGLIKQRISLTFDYYNKYTSNLLLSVPVPATTGYTSLVQNYGAVSNKGIELGIEATMIQQKNINWSMNFNISHNNNLIEKLAAPFNTSQRDLFRYKEGYPMYSFYFNKQLGVDPQTGAPIWKDVNGDGKFTASGDRTIVGNANPNFIGGIRSDLKFYQFDLSIFFNYSYGNKELYFDQFFGQNGGTRAMNFLKSQLQRWQKPGDITMVPKMTLQNYAPNLRPSRFIYDGSYIRLKNITLSYSLPKTFVDGLGIKGFNIFFTGKNLLTFTSYPGLDPELNGLAGNHLAKGIEFYTVPHDKVYMFGIDLTF